MPTSSVQLLCPVLMLFGLLLAATSTSAATLPSPMVPDGLGVNIHFTGDQTRDLDMIQAAGFRFIRMDFIWEAVEKEKGKYDFTAYDQLTKGLQRRGIRPLYILDYSNPLYETDRSVRTEEGRQAFARFAAAAAARYRGQGILWELWNEPNIDVFWKPSPNVDDYMALAKVVFPAIRKADPNALCVAPATSTIDLNFLEGCFKQGLLEMVDAVTVHPYRGDSPETVAPEYAKLRALIKQYHPRRPDLPIISGEWGYAAGRDGLDVQKQGDYMARQFLTNLSLGIPLSIWYDWHDDGQEANDPEQNFGTVTYTYQPKPAYQEMQHLDSALKGKRFDRRLPTNTEDYLLVFSRGKEYTLAAWTIGVAHEVTVAADLRIMLTGTPTYHEIRANAISGQPGK